MLTVSDGEKKILIPSSQVFFLSDSSSSSSKRNLNPSGVIKKFTFSEEEEQQDPNYKDELDVFKIENENEKKNQVLKKITNTNPKKKQDIDTMESLLFGMKKNHNQCNIGNIAFYDYLHNQIKCFKFKALKDEFNETENETTFEMKRNLLNHSFQEQLKYAYRAFETLRNKIYTNVTKEELIYSLETIQTTILEIRNKERAAIRFGEELIYHLQLMELECQSLKDDHNPPMNKSYCIKKNHKMWKVKGYVDDYYTLQTNLYHYLQMNLSFWYEINSKLTHQQYSKTNIDEFVGTIRQQAAFIIKFVEYILSFWKEEEPSLADIVLYTNRAFSFLDQKKRTDALTSFNLAMHRFDQVSEKLKKNLVSFYDDQDPQKKKIWVHDQLYLWSITGWISSLFVAKQNVDFIDHETIWATLLNTPSSSFQEKNALPPLFNYTFFSWSLFLDPLIVNSTNQKLQQEQVQNENIFTHNNNNNNKKKKKNNSLIFEENFEAENEKNKKSRFQIYEQGEFQKMKTNNNISTNNLNLNLNIIESKAFELLPFLPCDIRLKSHVQEVKTISTFHPSLHIYQYQWNHLAQHFFGLHGSYKNFLGHELEILFPGSTKNIHNYQCIRWGILQFYLDYVAPKFFDE